MTMMTITPAGQAPAVNLNLSIGLTDTLQKSKISVENYFVLICFSTNRNNFLEVYLSSRNNEQKVAFMQELLRKQLLVTPMSYEQLVSDFSLNHYTLTEIAQELCTTSVSGDSAIVLEKQPLLLQAVNNLIVSGEEKQRQKFDAFVNEFLNKFPESKKNNGGKTIRTNFEDTKAKLIKFMNKYKRYNDFELILKAATRFVDNFRGDFSYCPTAEYFISKNGTSALATECEVILAGKSEGKKSNPFDKLM